MNARETFRTALEALNARKLRSALTMLGILIGIAAVMLTVGLGEGASKKVTDQINSLGSNLLIVTPGSTTGTNGVRGGRGSATTLTSDDAALLASPSVAPDVAAVAPASAGSQAVTAKTASWTTTVTGTVPSWLQVRARSVSAGRFFSQSEVNDAALVAVIGQTTAAQLFGSEDPVGQLVTINGQGYTVVGELASVGATATTDEDDTLVVPRTTYAARLSTASNTRAVSSIFIEAKDNKSLSAAYQETTAALLTSHGVTPATADFQVASQQALVATATSTAQILTLLLGGVAAISLLVGGIGVMNIMLVSVSERVQEIGLRKALGARPGTILQQFLVEASILGLVGGLLGIALGVGGALLLPRLIGMPVTISPVATVVALAVALIIGIAAGVYPASRAARLAPIDALRSE